MEEMVINIGDTGQVSGLHFDKFPLSFLGAMEIGRASEIFFNTDKQNWEVILPGDKTAVIEATKFDGYDEARSFEVEWLQACMKADCHPTSGKGRAIASSIRVTMIEVADEDFRPEPPPPPEKRIKPAYG